LTPHVPVPFGIVAGASRLFKPGMLVRSMIQDHFNNDAYSPTMSRRQECLEIFEGSITRVNRDIVRDVISVVSKGRRVKREKPDGINSKVLQLIESLCETGEIADAVSVAVREYAHVQLVNGGILEPELVLLQCH
jgi:hypothetical protein